MYPASLVRSPDPGGYTRVFRSSSETTQIEYLRFGSTRRDKPNGISRPDPRWMWEGGAAAVAGGKGVLTAIVKALRVPWDPSYRFFSGVIMPGRKGLPKLFLSHFMSLVNSSDCDSSERFFVLFERAFPKILSGQNFSQ